MVYLGSGQSPKTLILEMEKNLQGGEDSRGDKEEWLVRWEICRT